MSAPQNADSGIEEILDHVDPSRGLDDEQPTVDLLEKVLNQGNTDKTRDLYRETWDKFQSFWFCQTELQYLSEFESRHYRDVSDFIDSNLYDVAKLTRANHLDRLHRLLSRLASHNYVRPDLNVDPHRPKIETEDETLDRPLPVDVALDVDEFVRDTALPEPTHAQVEWILAFQIGLRVGAMVALDREDLHLDPDSCGCDDGYKEVDIKHPHLRLQHRPEIGLNLKRKSNSSVSGRLIMLTEPQAKVLAGYCFHHPNHSESDENGLYGLLCSSRSARRNDRTIYRDLCALTSPWTWRAECDCSPCEEQDPSTKTEVADTCDHARGPHAIRHASITHKLNKMQDTEATIVDVGKKVGSAPKTIRRYYDEADEVVEAARRQGRTAGL